MTTVPAFYNDACGFVRKVLGATPDPWQAEALDIISTHPRLAIRSGHDVGKTALLSWVAIWFALTRTEALVPLVANTQAQLRDVTWAELGRWLRRLPPDLAKDIEVGADRLTIPATGSVIVARTASKDNPESLQGFHAPAGRLLFLLEEASGVDDVVFEVARGALASQGAKVLMVGNPTRNSGYFYSAFHANRALWQTMHVPWALRPWTSPTYAEEVANEWGETGNVYRIRVLGEFPTTMDDALIPLELIEAAVGRDVECKQVNVIWGVDVGRGGDPSALIKRRGNHILEPVKLWHDADTMVIAGRVTREFEDTAEWKRPEAICVDLIGVGAGVYDRLRELGLPVIGINVGETEALEDNKRFVRLRDELFYKVRQWFHNRDCKIPNDPVLISELAAPSYKLTSSGKISVERKDEMKARGLKSPNAADALAMTFQVGDYSVRVPRQTHGFDNREAGIDAYADPRPARRSSGYFSGSGYAPVWHEGQQTHAINDHNTFD